MELYEVYRNRCADVTYCFYPDQYPKINKQFGSLYSSFNDTSASVYQYQFVMKARQLNNLFFFSDLLDMNFNMRDLMTSKRKTKKTMINDNQRGYTKFGSYYNQETRVGDNFLQSGGLVNTKKVKSKWTWDETEERKKNRFYCWKKEKKKT